MKQLLEKLKLRLPIIQAPMAGGIVTPEMIAEVGRCGGLGCLPLGYLNCDEARKVIRQTKAMTNKPFAVNVFIPSQQQQPNAATLQKMLAHVNHYHRLLRLPEKNDLKFLSETSAEELINIAVYEEQISIVSFTFGILEPKKIHEVQKQGVIVLGTATSVSEGQFLESLGCDAVIAQGFEAGGHRGGGFLEDGTHGLIGTMALIPQMVQAINLPVIAAGGIMDGCGIVAALALGAQAVQMGTAFLPLKESGASELYKKRLLQADENATCLTSVYTGKPVRAITNDFILETEKAFAAEEMLPYPLQHQLTKELRKQANILGATAYTGFWSGQGSRLAHTETVANAMLRFEAEMKKTLSDLQTAVVL